MKMKNNEKGVALLMVTTAIVLLSVIMIGFSYDTNINKIKTYNIEDRANAKLTAMAGIKFAMTRLDIYKEAYNYLENNEQAKDFANQELINSIWNFPFVYPIIPTKKMNKIQKDAIEKFSEETFLEGQMQLTISNISNRMNLNLLRLDIISANSDEAVKKSEDETESEEDLEYSIETQLVRTLRNAIEAKSKTDEEFSNAFTSNDNQLLVNIIKFNISDQDSIEDPGEAENEFANNDLTSKNAPLSSMSELYALPLWKDELIELIARDFTPHGGLMIDLNKITDKMLKNLFPEISDEEIKDFFEFKNDPNNPTFFNTTEDFKSYFVNQANIVSAEDFDSMIAKFKAQGINFGPAATVFKITSTGVKGRATVNINAYVVLPVQPTIPIKQMTDEELENETDEEKKKREEAEEKAKADQKVQLLNARIVEIFIE
jgi:hypothetical protein